MTIESSEISDDNISNTINGMIVSVIIENCTNLKYKIIDESTIIFIKNMALDTDKWYVSCYIFYIGSNILPNWRFY